VVEPSCHGGSHLDYQITGLNMQGLDPQEFYPRKTTDRALAVKIKETYGDVEKGT
jgi:hypothetical protein